MQNIDITTINKKNYKENQEDYDRLLRYLEARSKGEEIYDMEMDLMFKAAGGDKMTKQEAGLVLEFITNAIKR